VATREVLVVLREAAAAAKPAVGALNDPALWYYEKPFDCIRTLNDFQRNAGLLLHLVGCCFALVPTIGNSLLERWKALAGDFQERGGGVTILHVAGRDYDVDQQAECVDRRMTLFPLDFLCRVISSRINLCPPFSALFTVWLSMIASVGVSDLPSSHRTSSCSAL